MVTGLAQWIDSGQWPPTINWVGIGLGAAVGAATQLLAFLSQSFGDYKDQMKTGDTVPQQTVTDKPK